MRAQIGESQRDSGTKPRVARHELPWEYRTKRTSTPNGVVAEGILVEPQPRWGYAFFARLPRVGAARQPWALGRNPFGIRGNAQPNLWIMQRANPLQGNTPTKTSALQVNWSLPFRHEIQPHRLSITTRGEVSAVATASHLPAKTGGSFDRRRRRYGSSFPPVQFGEESVSRNQNKLRFSGPQRRRARCGFGNSVLIARSI